MRKKVILSYKDNKIITQAMLILDKKILKSLKIDENDNIYLQYNNKVILLEKSVNKNEVVLFSPQDELLQFNKNIKLQLTYTNKEKGYYNYRLKLPLPIAKDMKLDEQPVINLTVKNQKIYIEKINESKKQVYTIKVNKGGIGKTFLTVQLGHGLALQGYKVLLLTSDSQNNILHYAKKKNELDKHDLSKGLRHAVLYGDNEDYYISLRKNLDFIPTESSIFTERFGEKFEDYIEKKKKEYDYILIDSIPTMDIDKKFMELSDQIIIPTFCDYSTVEGTIKVIEEIGANKIAAIIVNLYKNTTTQKEYYNMLYNILKDTDILFPEPIKELSKIEELIEKGKTVWESKSSYVSVVQQSLIDIILKIGGQNE